MAGVIDIIRDGSFVALVAEKESQAVKALAALREKAIWTRGAALPADQTVFDYLQAQPAESVWIVKGAPVAEPIPPVSVPPEAVQTLQAKYKRPYHMHAALGPSAAAAQWVDGQMTVWSHTQGAFPLRDSIAHVLGLPAEQVRLIHTEGAGCYGHNGADDAALDAALVARAVAGRPVLLKWMREDEHGWEPYGSAMVIENQASLDREGRIIDWNHELWSYAHSTRPRGNEEGSRSAGKLASGAALRDAGDG